MRLKKIKLINKNFIGLVCGLATFTMLMSGITVNAAEDQPQTASETTQTPSGKLIRETTVSKGLVENSEFDMYDDIDYEYEITEYNYEYDQAGNLIRKTKNYNLTRTVVEEGKEDQQSTKAYQNTSTYEYDTEGRIVKETLDSITNQADTATYEYDTAGRIIKLDIHISRYNGYSTYSIYPKDLKGLEEYYDDTPEYYENDAEYYYPSGFLKYSKAINVWDSRGTAGLQHGTYIFEYDAFGNITTMTHYNSGAEKSRYIFEYDAFGNITKMTTITAAYGIYKGGTSVNYEYVFEYDAYGNITKATRVKNNYVLEYKYEYDSVGNVKKITLPNNKTYEYNAEGKPVRGAQNVTKLWSDVVVPIRETYTYDANGNLVRKFYNSGDYTYKVYTWNYDANGNSINHTYQYYSTYRDYDSNTPNKTSITTYEYAY